jgi:hypothetical protein
MPKLRGWWNNRGPDEFEHRMVHPPSHWIDRRLVAFVLAYGAVLLGVWAEFDNEVGPALGRALQNLSSAVTTRSMRPLIAPIHARTAVFTVLLAVIATLLWKRLKADDRKQDERTLGVLRALYRVPNISVVSQFAELYWPRFVEALWEDWPDDSKPTTEQRAAMGRNIRNALAVIVAMTHQFARGERARYGANIMLMIGPSGPHYFPDELVKKLRFHSPNALGELAGLLYLPGELLVANLPGYPERTIAHIVLPIPFKATDDRQRRLVIPGAPQAALRGGGPSVHEDTRRIATECADFSAPIRDEIAHYFSDEGDGKDVRSFASVRLGNASDPIGVLNIDSDQPYVLGHEDEFYVSFYAMLRPMLDVLGQAVTEYADLLEPEIEV